MTMNRFWVFPHRRSPTEAMGCFFFLWFLAMATEWPSSTCCLKLWSCVFQLLESALGHPRAGYLPKFHDRSPQAVGFIDTLRWKKMSPHRQNQWVIYPYLPQFPSCEMGGGEVARKTRAHKADGGYIFEVDLWSRVNFIILKWSYCNIFQAIFFWDLLLHRLKQMLGTSNRILSRSHW